MTEHTPADLVRQMMEPLRHDIARVHAVLEQERRVQGELAGRLVAPVDAVFDLLQQSAAAMERQAEALASAGAALSEAATLMRTQAELFDRSVAALRQPVRLIESAAGVPPAVRPPDGAPAPAGRAARGRRAPRGAG
ncbi:MAG TPA: hypothetical protein VFT50_03960 [Baekduia sp.]|nr:hypothetical protein [Baekduia sp.]